MEDMHINNLIEKNVDGIIYISGHTELEIDDKYTMPVVYIDRSQIMLMFLLSQIMLREDTWQGRSH